MLKKKLLIADDNIQYCAALENCFRDTGAFDVMPSVYDGVSLLDSLDDGELPDVLILDMVMPKMDGLGVLEKLNAMQLTQRMLVFANSSFVDDAIVEIAMQLGAVYFLVKPMQMKTVLERVMNICGMQQEKAAPGQGAQHRDVSREQMITNYLRILGIPVHASGYIFLKTAIDYCIEHYGKVFGMTTVVYPYVADIHNSLPKRVERNIRHAIEYAWDYGNINAQHRIFGYTVHDAKGRPTNKEFIALITDRVVLQLKYR